MAPSRARVDKPRQRLSIEPKHVRLLVHLEPPSSVPNDSDLRCLVPFHPAAQRRRHRPQWHQRPTGKLHHGRRRIDDVSVIDHPHQPHGARRHCHSRECGQYG